MGNYDLWDEGDDDDRYDEPDECDHEHADFDILEGRMRCMCGYQRWLTAEDIDAEIAHMAAYNNLEGEITRQNRWWRRLLAWARERWAAVLRPGRVEEDGIPF